MNDSILGSPIKQWTVAGVWFRPDEGGTTPVYIVSNVGADTPHLAALAFVTYTAQVTEGAEEDDIGICAIFPGDAVPIPPEQWLPEYEEDVEGEDPILPDEPDGR